VKPFTIDSAVSSGLRSVADGLDNRGMMRLPTRRATVVCSIPRYSVV